jgi:cytoplasmic tRNA 2-thiolation protein 1
VLRGDIARLARTTSIVTSTPNAASSLTPNALSHIKRSKPLKYAYEKEIVLYAHHKSLDYFSTECIYSPEAFRGSARTLIKDLERVRPTTILDIVRSGEDMARLCPGYEEYCANGCATGAVALEEGEGGCGSAVGRTAGGEMSKLDTLLAEKEQTEDLGDVVATEVPVIETTLLNLSKPKKQVVAKGVGQCERCGYMSSQKICKACVLLEGLNRSRPKVDVATSVQ